MESYSFILNMIVVCFIYLSLYNISTFKQLIHCRLN